MEPLPEILEITNITVEMSGAGEKASGGGGLDSNERCTSSVEEMEPEFIIKLSWSRWLKR